MGLGWIAGGLRGERRRGSLLADPGRLELLSVAALKDLLPPEALDLDDARGELRAVSALDHAVLERELARRTGDPRRLANAYQAAAVAAADAGGETRLFAAARLQTALCALTASEAFGDTEGPDRAEVALCEAEAALECAPGRLNGPGLIRARLASRSALGSLDREAVLTAASRFAEAAEVLHARVRATGHGEPEWAAALCERAELMVGYGAARKELGMVDRAADDMAALSARLDPTRLPLSWMRAETLRGSALRLVGEITGEARMMKDGAVALGGAFDAVPGGHSPLDRARAAHSLGLALQGLAEASGEALVYGSAQTAFDRALSELGETATPLRSPIAYDRAACLTRRAERNGDVFALSEAERVFRADLAGRTGGEDPVGWAVVQMALARVYQARGELIGSRSEMGDAAFALTEALEVFKEHGQRSLAEIALAALERIRGKEA